MVGLNRCVGSVLYLRRMGEILFKVMLVKPPDLQALVLKFGTYDRITEEAWREFDAAMAEYQARIRRRTN